MDKKKVTFELVEGSCSDCYFWKYDCGHVTTAIGLKCSPEYILKRVKQYVQCTPENTKVGDIVIVSPGDSQRVVSAVSGRKVCVKAKHSDSLLLLVWEDCKKEV